MPVEKESRIRQWVGALREGWPGWRARVDAWKDAIREDPKLIWATPAFRYTVYAAGGVVVLWAVTALLGQFAPPSTAAAPAKTADFHVLCTAPGCGHHFVINAKFKFDDFPVVCPQCHQKTGQRALRCPSATCHGRWGVPIRERDEYRCRSCGATLGKVD